MSQPYLRNGPDPLSLVPFDDDLLDSVTEAARDSSRRRSIIRFHEHGDPLQRMLNSIEPRSYTRPHRHADPARPEAFVALRGSVLVVRFDDAGNPVEGVLVGVDGPAMGVEVPAGAWHCLVSLRPGTVLFEVTQGPYDEATHKQLAPWAPAEEDVEAGAAYVAGLRGRFESILPQVAALNEIDAEEYGIC